MFLEEGINVKVVLLPEGEDPDSFSRSRNSFDFNLFMKEHEVDFIRFKVDLLMKDASDDPIKKAALTRNILESVAVIPDSIIRSVYIKECSYLFEEREQLLINEVSMIRRRKPQNTSYSTVLKQVTTEIKAEDADGDKEERRPENAEEASAGQEQAVENKVRNKTSPFKKYEALLVRYVIRYGEKSLFEEVVADDENPKFTTSKTTVAQYIQSELANDNIELQTPLYKGILEEAVANSGNDSFVAKKYFLSHPDGEISRLASDMISSRYQLSKYFTAPEEDTENSKSEEKKSKESEALVKQIIREIFALKYAYINHRISELNKKIKEDPDDEEKCTEWMKERIELDNLKCLLSKELGERIVTGMG
jgi:DNA primase